MVKNIISKISIAFIAMLFFYACNDRELITIDNQLVPVVMDLSSESLTLDENFPGNPALTVTWDDAEYTVPVEIKYNLQVSTTETFVEPLELASTTATTSTVTFTNKQLNDAAKALGLTPYVSQKVFFRVISSIGTGNVNQQISNVTSLMLTPYIAAPTYPYTDLYLIGSSTAAGWDNSATNINLIPLLKNATSTTKYSYTGYFSVPVDPGFKIIKVKGSWDEQYGSGGAGVLSTSGGSGNITVPSAGYYKLEIDIAALTYTLTPVTETATYTTVSIIGNGGDWNTDIPLTKSSFDPHLWIGSGIALSEGEIKFRAENSWTVSWGNNAEYFGTAALGSSSNIPVSSDWTYNVYFNDVSGAYTIIPID